MGNSKEIQSNIILAALVRWSCAIRTWYSPWRRQKDMGGLLVAPRHHNKFFMGQLGGHGCLTDSDCLQAGRNGSAEAM